MAVEPERLPARRRPTRATSVVSFDAEAGVVVRRARLFEDGALASESLTVTSTPDGASSTPSGGPRELTS